MNFNRETDHTPNVQPDLSPLASLGRSLQARAGWSRRALSPWVQRRLESTQPDSSARARSFTLTRSPIQAMMVGQLQRTTEETLVSRPTIGSVNPLLVENFTQEVAGRHAQQIEPKYQPQTSDTWTNAPADLTWSGLAEAEETQPAPPAPARLPFTVDQIRQAMERQQSGLPPLPITSSPTPAPTSTQTVQTKRETNFPFSVAEVRAALEQPHFAKAPEIKRPSTPPSSSRQRRWVEEVTPPAAGTATPSADPSQSFSQPETPAAESPRPLAKPPVSPPPVQRQVMPPFEPTWQPTETPEMEPEQRGGFDEPGDAASSFATRLETALPPIETAAQPTASVQLKPQPASLPRLPEAESARPAESIQPQRSASAPVQRQMPSRPRPPRSEPVWQMLDPTNLPSNRVSEFDQSQPEPDELFQGDEPAQTLTPAATGTETAPFSMKPAVQRQPDIEASPSFETSSALEMPLRLPQTEPDEAAQTVELSASESEAPQPPGKPTVQRQPTFEAPSQPEPSSLEMPLRLPQIGPDEVAQVVEPVQFAAPSVSGEETASPSTKPTVLSQPQVEPDNAAQPTAPISTFQSAATTREAAPSARKSVAQRRPDEVSPQAEKPSALEMPLRRPEPGPDETTDLAETTPSMTGREVTSSPRPPTVQRQLALEPQTEPPSSLEMPLRLPEIEPTEIVPPIEPSQAAAPGVVEPPVPSSFSQPAAQRQLIPEPQHQAEPASTMEMPLRLPPAEPGAAAQSVEPSSASAMSEATPPLQSAVQRRPEDETPPHRTEPQPEESPQIPDLPQTKTLDGEWSGFDGPEEMLLRRVEADKLSAPRQMGVLPQVRQPFEVRPEQIPTELEKTGEPVLPLAQPLATRPEAAGRLDMPLAAPSQPVSKASERREEPPFSASMPTMNIQRYWEPEAALSPSVATDNEIEPIQRVEDTEISFSEEPETPAAELDLDDLARQVYPLVRQMLAVERNRRPFR